MNAKLLYIALLESVPKPAVQVNNGGKIVITSIRLSAPTNNNGTYEIHHLRNGEAGATTSNTLAFNVALSSKSAIEFLTHPIPLSPGESIFVSGSHVVIAIYGIEL
jgi:hypothetical protein